MDLTIGLSQIFPRIRRLNENNLPFGPTGLIIKYSLFDVVHCYWGTENKKQHMTTELLINLMVLQRRNNGTNNKKSISSN